MHSLQTHKKISSQNNLIFATFMLGGCNYWNCMKYSIARTNSGYTSNLFKIKISDTRECTPMNRPVHAQTTESIFCIRGPVALIYNRRIHPDEGPVFSPGRIISRSIYFKFRHLFPCPEAALRMIHK